MTLKPIPDRADVTLDFPEKLYIGSFSDGSSFEVTADPNGLGLRLVHRQADKRTIELHINHYLLAGILDEAAASLAALGDALPAPRRNALRDAATNLRAALAAPSEVPAAEIGEIG